MQGFYYVPVPLGAKKTTPSNVVSGSGLAVAKGSNPTLAIASANTDPSKKPRVNVPLMKGRMPSTSASSTHHHSANPTSSNSSTPAGYMNFNLNHPHMNMNMSHLNNINMNMNHLNNMNHHATSLINSSSAATVSSTAPPLNTNNNSTISTSSQMCNSSIIPSSSSSTASTLSPTSKSNNNHQGSASQPQNHANNNPIHSQSNLNLSNSNNNSHHHGHHSNNILPLTSVHQANASAPIFTGLWHLNREKSDSVNNYLEAMGLPSIARQAADKLDLAVIVHQTAHDFTITRKTRIFTDTKTLKFGHDMIIKNVPMRMTASAQSLKTVSQLPQVRGVLIDTRTLEMGGQMMHVVLELNLPDKPPTIVHRYFNKVSESTSLDIDEALYNTLYTPPSEVKRKR